MIKKDFFAHPVASGIIGIIALISGFYFLNSKITGNVIAGEQTSFNVLSLIGLLLIGCSIILVIYSVKKK